MAPSSISGLNRTRPSRSEGQAKDVYDQMRTEFFVASPFVLHGEVPSLLAASWSLVRETLFVGEADRGEKEIIAWAVSQSNRCPLGVDAHGAAKLAADSDNPTIERWARASASAESAATVSPPKGLSSHRAEYLGTVTAAHYLNRMINIFLGEKMVPLPNAFDGVTQSMTRFMMGGMLERAAHLEAGDSLQFLSESDPVFGWRPLWAEGSPTVSDALSGWSSTVEQEANNRFEPALLAVLINRVDHWDGNLQLIDPTDGLVQVDMYGTSFALIKLAILAVEAPFQVEEQAVKAAVESSSSEDTMALVAWAAQRAARRCADWTADKGSDRLN